VTSFDKALAIRSDDAEVLANRGQRAQGLGHLEEAVTSFDKALAIRPDCAEALANRGSALRDLGRLEEAWANFDKALAIRPIMPRRATIAQRAQGAQALAEAMASFDGHSRQARFCLDLFNRGLCNCCWVIFRAGGAIMKADGIATAPRRRA
jgi:tetratricopeptide (TPR) repeat protein